MTKIEEDDIEYLRFREAVFDRRETYSQIPSGSFFELPLEYFLKNPTDIDLMFNFSRDVAGFENVESYIGTTSYVRFLVDTKNCHVGFARLREIKSPLTGEISDFYRKPQYDRNCEDYGPSKSRSRISSDSSNSNIFSVILGIVNPSWQNPVGIKFDHVYAISCKIWPNAASDWKTRKREHGWPSFSVIDKIVNSGFHFVSKAYEGKQDDTLWRYSFSQAEAILIKQWTAVQKHIYHVLRLIKDDVVKSLGGDDKTVLRTYFFKTLMFWACEQKSVDFWNINNIETVVEQLICLAIEWLMEKQCPHYFIRAYNMLDYLSNEDDLSSEISLLSAYMSQNLTALLDKVGPPKTIIKMTICASMPKNLLEHILCLLANFVIYGSRADNIIKIFALSDDFIPEMRFLFNGIKMQLSIGKSNKDFQNKIQMAAKCFVSAIQRRNEISGSSFTFHFGESGLDIIERARTFALECHNSSSLIKEDTVVAHSSKVTSVEVIINEGLKKLASIWNSPLLFLSMAYYANFLYVVLKDFNSAIEQCRRTFSGLKSLRRETIRLESGLFERAFFVLIANKWSALFDAHLQTVFGFLTLCSAVRTERCRPIAVNVCPIAFLKYIYFQSAKELGIKGAKNIRYKSSHSWSRMIYGIFSTKTISKIIFLASIAASGNKLTHDADRFIAVL